MSDRLWSPQLRKWVRDADKYGIEIGWYKARKQRNSTEEGGGSVLVATARITDSGDTRITDSGSIRVTDT